MKTIFFLIILPSAHTITTMREQRIEYRTDKQIDAYLEIIFEDLEVPCRFERTDEWTACLFVSADEVRKDIISELLLTFYKFKELTGYLNDYREEGGYSYYALLGALLGVEKAADSEYLKKILDGAEVVNIDGIYEFRMETLKQTWENLAKIIVRLLSCCKCAEDIYALSTFVMNPDDNPDSTVVVGAAGNLYWEKLNREITVVPYYGERRLDAIVTLLSKHPANVLIRDPNNVDEGLMTVIEALGGN